MGAFPIVRIHTLGFTGKSAERFFGLLREAGVARVDDVRTSNTSQLAGFTKRGDLAFFLRELAGIDYRHWQDAAPPLAMMRAYRRGELDWPAYAAGYRALLEERGVAVGLEPHHLDGACLLCSEPTPERCHRRLLAEYLEDALRGRARVEILHL